ncbi:MAG: hypothetical protein AAGH76_02665 [Pseudomonadota bacterium]
MHVLIIVSLLANVIVLVPVCYGLLVDASWTASAYGPPTDARQILLSVYLAIGLVSAVLLVLRDPRLVAALLAVQVAYKLSTPLTVGSIFHPVVMTNLAVAMLHMVTLVAIWRTLLCA